MRGGIQNLGWDGVLHMFISWYILSLPSQAWPPCNGVLTHDLGKSYCPPQ